MVYYQLYMLCDMNNHAKTRTGNGDHLTVELLEGMRGLPSGACRHALSTRVPLASYLAFHSVPNVCTESLINFAWLIC